MQLYRRKCIIFLTVLQFFIVSGLVPATQAGLVSTQSQLQSAATDDTRNQLQALLNRDDVRQEMIKLGVDPEMATKRVAVLTPSELAQLQQRMDEMPTGAGALEVIGILFLVLIILEFLGVTNVFTRV